MLWWITGIQVSRGLDSPSEFFVLWEAIQQSSVRRRVWFVWPLVILRSLSRCWPVLVWSAHQHRIFLQLREWGSGRVPLCCLQRTKQFYQRHCHRAQWEGQGESFCPTLVSDSAPSPCSALPELLLTRSPLSFSSQLGISLSFWPFDCCHLNQDFWSSDIGF